MTDYTLFHLVHVNGTGWHSKSKRLVWYVRVAGMACCDMGVNLVWHGIVCHGVAWHGSMEWCGIARYCMVWRGIAWYGSAWYGIERYDMAWYRIRYTFSEWFSMICDGMAWYGWYRKTLWKVVWHATVWHAMPCLDIVRHDMEWSSAHEKTPDNPVYIQA